MYMKLKKVNIPTGRFLLVGMFTFVTVKDCKTEFESITP